MDTEQWINNASNELDEIARILQEKRWLEQYNMIVSKIQEIHNFISTEINEWNYCHQRAQVGWPVPNPLNDLQPICEKLAQVLSTMFQQTKQLMTIFHGQESQLKILCNQSRSMLAAFLKRCLVIEKQPPPVIKKGKIFHSSLRLLLGNRFLSSQDLPIVVTCSLHLDSEIMDIINGISPRVVPMKDSIETKDFEENSGVFTVTYNKLKLPPSKKNTNESVNVVDQKSCLLFQTQVTIAAETFLVEALSVPIVMVTHSDYYRESEATTLWDNAFGVKDRRPFDVPEHVTFHQLMKALNNRWEMWNGRGISEKQRAYLARKLFPDITPMEDFQNLRVTKNMFHKDVKIRNKFTFWAWFYENMKLVKECMADAWRDGFIEGFISRADAEQSLKPMPVGTFLLRFSEGFLGGISVSYKQNILTCTSMDPWFRVELEKMPLSQCLRDIPQFKFLHPNLIPKETAFLEATAKKDDDSPYPVKKRLRVEIDDGDRPPSSPSQSWSIPADDSAPTASDASMVSSLQHEQPFSPASLNLDDDPLLSQANLHFSIDDLFNSDRCEVRIPFDGSVV